MSAGQSRNLPALPGSPDGVVTQKAQQEPLGEPRIGGWGTHPRLRGMTQRFDPHSPGRWTSRSARSAVVQRYRPFQLPHPRRIPEQQQLPLTGACPRRRQRGIATTAHDRRKSSRGYQHVPATLPPVATMKTLVRRGPAHGVPVMRGDNFSNQWPNGHCAE